jgi:hypothetical protein
MHLCVVAVSGGALKLSESSFGTLIAIRAPSKSLAVELALLLELFGRQNGADVAAGLCNVLRATLANGNELFKCSEDVCWRLGVCEQVA